ncbi:MAG: hypothetical protein CMJ19_14310 [Phycisphaeraceae bacterium]|nr:hypothetical protein [Phycisphaeraceae bacterium]
MTKRNKKRHRILKKQTAKARKRQRLIRSKIVGRQKTEAQALSKPHDKIAGIHTYLTPFGVVVSEQNPEAMHLHNLGGVQVHRPRIAAEVQVRGEAEKSLRSKHSPGKYVEQNEINHVLQGHFQFYDDELKRIIPMIGSRHFMEFVLSQYDQSCKVDVLFKKSQLSAEDSEYWSGMGQCWRRALKYLAECTCLLAPDEAPSAPEQMVLDLTDRAIICAENLVKLSALSDQTYMLFPDRTELIISESGELNYLDLRVHPEIGSDFQERVRRDLSVRGKYNDLDYPLFDKTIRADELNPGFNEVFGIDYEECFSLFESIFRDVVVQPEAFPIAFVQRDQLIASACKITGASHASITKLIDGVTVSRTNMMAEGRKIWKPKQEHRAYRRGFFDFPHPTGRHIVWSEGMAKECLLMLFRDIAFQHVPPEWDEAPIRPGLAKLSNRCGKEFESVCIKHIKQRGFVIASSFKDGIGQTGSRLLIPKQVGELDCLAYSPTTQQLALLECKLVQSGMEAARLRDDIQQFTNVKNGYFLKYQRKLEWLRANTSAVCRALESLPDAPAQITPTHIAGAIVTLYPSFASHLSPPVPCVSLGELFSEWDRLKSWPYPAGLFPV